MREASSIYLCMPGQPNGRWTLPYAGQPPDDDGRAARAAAAPPRRAIPSGAVAGAAVCGAVVALLLAAAVTACVFAGVKRRLRKRGDDEESVSPASSASPPPPPPKHTPNRWAELPLPRSRPSTAKQSSDDPSSSRAGRNGTPVEDGTPPHLPPLPGSPPSPAAATGVPSDDSLGEATSTITNTHPLTFPSVAGAAGGATLEGAWLRRRIGPADAPDELGVGPLIGRGSFGAVYKPRWFGGLCVLKVVPLSPEAASAAVASTGAGGGVAASDLTPVSAAVGVRVGRELSLGVALSHPHLVATYRAWIVDAGAVGAHRASWEGSRSGGDDTAAAAAAANAAAWTPPPPSPSLPNADRSISLDRADSGLLAEVEEAAAAAAAAAGADPAAAAAAAASTLTAIAPTSTPAPAPREAWILLELCSLGTLDAAVRARRFAPAGSPAALAAALRSLRDVAAGMEYLHAHTVVHGDLKACNVLLKPVPRTTFDARGFTAKVADFGLARFVGARGHVSTHTHGSVQYMAPEVLAARRVGLPADVFSFGVLAAEVLTGRKPHSGRTVGAVVHAVVAARERPDVPAAAAPAALRALVDACCEDDERARPTFAAILDALHAFCEGDWDSEDATWHRGGGAGAGGKGAAAVARVVPAVVVEAARVASGGSMRGGGAAVAVSSPGKGRGGPASDAWEE